MVPVLKVEDATWQTATQYQQSCGLVDRKFLEVTNLLLENPNLNSTHLFRADILYDDARLLRTVSEKDRQCRLSSDIDIGEEANEPEIELPDKPPVVDGAVLQRKVLRKLIPRKPQLDSALSQWCYIYELTPCARIVSGYAVVYVPMIENEADMPWYHPQVKALAYLYEHKKSETTLSVHFLPFSQTPSTLPPRIHRTMISLLQTFLRLAKDSAKPTANGNGLGVSDVNSFTELSLAPSSLKDTILPQHVVQDTYSRLKQQYAADLVSRWVEKTEPSKHVFEDLSIAAFLIELWKQTYSRPGTFPGFLDIACGNGVLTYVLIKEGYHGRGFDARRRHSWRVLEMEDYLDEMVCIPQPFLDHAPSALNISRLQETGMRIHNGILNGLFNGLLNGLFKPGTFIISNHADELTPWTPILAALSSPESPLPFLAIPCCSHALSGAKYRYTLKDIAATTSAPSTNRDDDQSATGDLKALRAAKIKAANHQDDQSMYACLTKKVVALAEEMGSEVELTLMRIPSTRNIGIVGNRRRTFASVNAATRIGEQENHPGNKARDEPSKDPRSVAATAVREKIDRLLDRECAMSGGMTEAARCWIERAQKLQKGQGRGKVNLKGKPPLAS